MRSRSYQAAWRRSARTFGWLALAVCATILGGAPLAVAQASPSQQTQSGVLLELFTSQSCALCPPADKLLGELARREGVIALSLNVEYYSYMGWTDPLAQEPYKTRHRLYAMRHKIRSHFTPQLVVQGVSSVRGGDLGAVTSAVKSAKRDQRYEIDLKKEGDAVIVTLIKHGAEADAAKKAAGVDCFVMAAPYRRQVVQKIGKGGNGGKTLTYNNVALELRRLGAFSDGTARFSAPIPAEADGVAVWVQRATSKGPYGEVRSAAKLEF